MRQSNICDTCFLAVHVLFGIYLLLPRCFLANDSLNNSQQLFPPQTLVSVGSIFELGFFDFDGSNRSYVGIWCKNVSVRTIVWVLNREAPLAADEPGSNLAIGDDGNLRLADGKKNIVWSSNVSIHSNNTFVMLNDDGNLVLRERISNATLWESFNFPGNTLLPGMMIGFNTKTGLKRSMLSWKAVDDPSPGNFSVGLSIENPPQGFVWNGLKPYWRSGSWDGSQFKGIPDGGRGYSSGLLLPTNSEQGTSYFTFNKVTDSLFTIAVIMPNGLLKIQSWFENSKEWNTFWEAPANPCDNYGICGPAAVCNINGSPLCECLKGYVPKSSEEWIKENWSSGCTRRAQLQCEKDSNKSDSTSSKSDQFWELSGVKLPDFHQYITRFHPLSCKEWCLRNCSCVAYSTPVGLECMVWTADLVDMQMFSSNGDNLFLRLAHSEIASESARVKLIVGFTTAGFVVLLIIIFTFLYCRWKAKLKGMQYSRQGNAKEDGRLPTESTEIPVIDFLIISSATSNFSDANKLGQGGFGSVYKGRLEDGVEIAVKRLSSDSGQGNEEFKNEVILISKLQHRNLVRLLGYSIHGDEKLIVYEYMKNKSLDSFLFDPAKKLQLDWAMRFDIIQGIARGLLYLHRDSCLRVIHRDLKSSNILLDEDMNPKISDFGLARAFRAKQSLANTLRVVGTFGYMSPEYAMGGLFSEKSDVYSFGVLLLEIISGRKNSTGLILHHDRQFNLISHGWKLWNEGRGLEFADESMAMAGSFLQPEALMRCLQIGLLCVQDHATDRPTMSTVVVMMSSGMQLPPPKQPTFPFESEVDFIRATQGDHTLTVNEVSASMIEGR